MKRGHTTDRRRPPSQRARSRRSPSRQTSLLTRFSTVSFAVVVVVGVALGSLLQQSIRNRAITDAARTGEVAANVGVRPFLLPADLQRNFAPLDQERIAELETSLGASLSPNGVVRIKVWNLQHWLVYSDNDRLRGRWFAGVDALERSFEGQLTSQITDLSAPEEREERDFGELLAVYVPLRIDSSGEFTSDASGEIIGAFEVYLPFAPIAADIQADTRRLWIGLVGGLGLLYLALFRIVSSASRTLERQARENIELATRDSLTGLPNRDAFLVELATGSPPKKGDVIAVLDLERFQTINDTLGYDRGDELLRIVAGRLVDSVRAGDQISRLGGNSYAVLLHGVGDQEKMVDSLTRIIEKIHEPVTLDDLELDIRASVGGVVVDNADDRPERLVQRAEVALSEAKRRQTAVEFYRPDFDRFSAETLRLVSDVRTSIHDGNFVLHYQPKIDLSSGEIIAAEALVRWQHPEIGFIPPGQFIPALEVLPIGRELTDHVVEQAIASIRRRADEGGPSIPIAVNLSARDVNDPELFATIKRLLDRYGVDGHLLTLELTESSVLTNEEQAINTLASLRTLGCGVAIDDFGTGYASLRYLMRLPATELKIDQSFISRLDNDPTAEEIVAHCIGLGRTLDLEVTAEGIETEEIVSILRGMHCDVGQGYLFSKPLPLPQFEQYLADPRASFGPVPTTSNRKEMNA